MFGSEYKGLRAAVIGLGVSNQAVVRWLAARGALVTAFDRKTAGELGEVYDRLNGLGVAWSLGEGYLLKLDPREFDVVFLTPGMRKDLPEIARLREAGVRLHSEIGLVFDYCPAPVIGITGSAGKTTTTTLTGLVLGETGRRVFVGGNIGEPLLERLEEMTPDDLVVLELSSFQLQMLCKSPHIGVLLNIRPNHLDIHASFEEYVEAKRNIVRFQGRDDVAVLNADDAHSAACAGLGEGRVALFSGRREVEAGAFCRDGRVIVRWDGREETAGEAAEIRLPGAHNLENALAALCIAAAAGVPAERAWSAIRGFAGVEHRLEPVRELRGVRYINDSIATAPDRTAAALASFDAPLILIAGGYDKKIPYDDLGPLIVDRVRKLILIGQTAPKIRAAVERAAAPKASPGPEIVDAASLEEAVRLAASAARPGDVVLLSPASASYDMFTDYRERGRRFKECVQRLPEGLS